MSGMPTGTICSKHDNIMELCKKLGALARDIESVSDDIYRDSDYAKDDGIRMEDALYKRKNRIEELEEELSTMEKDRDHWRGRAEDAEAELSSRPDATEVHHG